MQLMVQLSESGRDSVPNMEYNFAAWSFHPDTSASNSWDHPPSTALGNLVVTKGILIVDAMST